MRVRVRAAQKLNKYVEELQTSGPPKPIDLEFFIYNEKKTELKPVKVGAAAQHMPCSGVRMAVGEAARAALVRHVRSPRRRGPQLSTVVRPSPCSRHHHPPRPPLAQVKMDRGGDLSQLFLALGLIEPTSKKGTKSVKSNKFFSWMKLEFEVGKEGCKRTRVPA